MSHTHKTCDIAVEGLSIENVKSLKNIFHFFNVSYLPILIMTEIMTEVVYYFEALAKFETFTERQTKKN